MKTMKAFLSMALLAALMAGCSSAPQDSADTAKDSTADSTPQNEEVTSDTPANIPVESESQKEADADSETISVTDAINNQESLVDNQTTVTIEGYLPQDARVDDAGNAFTDIQASIDTDNPDEWIEIANSDALNFGGCKAALTGTLNYNADGVLVLNVTEAKEIAE